MKTIFTLHVPLYVMPHFRLQVTLDYFSHQNEKIHSLKIMSSTTFMITQVIIREPDLSHICSEILICVNFWGKKTQTHGFDDIFSYFVCMYFLLLLFWILII